MILTRRMRIKYFFIAVTIAQDSCYRFGFYWLISFPARNSRQSATALWHPVKSGVRRPLYFRKLTVPFLSIAATCLLNVPLVLIWMSNPSLPVISRNISAVIFSPFRNLRLFSLSSCCHRASFSFLSCSSFLFRSSRFSSCLFALKQLKLVQ